MQWLLVALGGACGAMARFGIAQLIPDSASKFPVSTFLANVSGCFIMGVGLVIIIQKGLVPMEWRYFLLVGMMGALTTFSTFAVEAVNIIQHHSWQNAAIYVFSSLLAGMGAVFIGATLTQKLI